MFGFDYNFVCLFCWYYFNLWLNRGESLDRKVRLDYIKVTFTHFNFTKGRISAQTRTICISSTEFYVKCTFYWNSFLTNIFEWKKKSTHNKTAWAEVNKIKSRPRDKWKVRVHTIICWFSCLSVINTIIEGKHCQGTWHLVNTRCLLDNQGQGITFSLYENSR